ncbi:helix-turn-helix transcriptional regulator [Weissella paramesenteroides]|uniref:helix-turn-helix domain-containing protein n=1 Tax=Weissella paramesenteroides TaxID=1249 RepID=UPI0024029574|nr:helix-turn-helix transcriptional regulator [Weissella paramesenteroides]MDF8366200.1 helix-turn-helix transcriptional regulator [Weissella paramesenteroides]
MRLKALRKDKNLTLVQLGNATGILPSNISRYENGLREPGISMLVKLADYFDVSVDYLIGHEKTPNCSNS